MFGTSSCMYSDLIHLSLIMNKICAKKTMKGTKYKLYIRIEVEKNKILKFILNKMKVLFI